MGKRKGPLAATKKKGGGGGGGGGDFKKRVAKVGKRAVKHANVTKVNVRSKQLYMPTQRLASASASSSASSTTTARVAPGQERTAKGHGLLELLHQTRHHNEGARAAGVQGLKELVTAHPGLGQREMATLLDGALELLLDPEEDVRRAALGLLRVLLLPSSSSAARSSSGPSLSAGVSDKGGGSGGGGDRHRASLLPFAPLAATYLCAALSHLDQSVRRDGLAYLDLLVQSLGPHLLPHAGGVLPSLASLLDRPPNPSKRQAARLLLQQKQAAAQGGGDESGMSAKEKDQHLKTRMELWAARAAVLRCALGLARLLPHTQAAGSAPQPLQGQQGQGQQAPSTPVVVEWRRTPRLLLLRPMQPSPQQPQETGPAAAEAEDGGQQDGGGVQSVEGLAALLSRVRNYVLELSSTTTSITISTGAAAAAAMDVDGGGEEEGAGGGEAPPPKGQGQGQGRHQVEGGPALDALAGAIEFALVATQCLAANSAVSVGSAGAGGEGEEGEEDDAAVGAAVGETRALIGALVALFPLQLADGATALRTSSSAAAAADNEEEEGEEGGGIVTEDGLNLALAEVAMLEGTAIDPGSRLKNNKQQQQQGGGLDAGVVAWLLALMARRARALGGGGTAEGERLGARLLRLLRGLLPRLYRRGEARVAERLVGALEACCSADAAAWPPASPNKRAALRLLCDLLPARPPLAAKAWVERTARTQLPQWCGGGAEETALVAPAVAVLLRAVATASEGDGEGYPWLPEAVTALLSSSSVMGARALGYRACDLVYYCPAWPVELQEAVVGVVHAGGAEGAVGLVDYLVEVLHHSRQLLSPSAYLTLLGRLLTLPPSPAAALPHAAAVGATVGRALCQLQQRPGSVLPLLAPLLVRLLRGGGVGEQDDGEGGPATNAPQRLAALVVIARVAAGGGEEEKQQQQRAEGGVAAASASVSLPPALIGPLVALALGGGSEAADEEEEEEEENEALAKASRPLLLALLRRHGPELLPPLVERATPFLLSSPPLSASSGASHSFQEWLREGGVNWAPAREGLAGLRAQCLGRLPQLQGVVHDLDLLPLGLGK